MPVDAQTMAVLELPHLLDLAAGLAQSSLGAALVRALRPCPILATISRRQKRLAQLRELLSAAAAPSLDGLDDMGGLLSRLEVAGAYLLPEELARVGAFLSAVSRAHAYLGAASGEHDEVFRLGNAITPLPEIAQRIRAIVAPDGGVKTSASRELQRLRANLVRVRDRLRSQLGELVSRPDMAGVFSDSVVTQRGDRFVVPVKTGAKGRLPGIIHDTSGSGATYFMEPLQAVEENNSLALLKRREAHEVERILLEISGRIAGQLQALKENQAALAKLDCLLAQARLAQTMDCIAPELGTGGPLRLVKARHPLLAWRAHQGRGRSVPISLEMDESTQVLVISGANAGGKTAALKTVGLLTLMAMCGLQVPLDPGSRLVVFMPVMAELGDEQDLNLELSTFTAHAGRLKEMLEQAGQGSLVLVDELGGGTDPGEGTALGIAFLEWLSKRGARVLCTTHFHLLKAFAAVTEGVNNVSVAFDTRTGEPTYQLAYGQPGVSDALTVARRLGLPPALVDQAESHLDLGERQAVELLGAAQEARQEAERELAAARAQKLAASLDRSKAQELLTAAQKERSTALSEGKRRVRQVAKHLEEKLLALFSRVEGEMDQEKEPKPGRLRQEVYAAQREALEEIDTQVGPLPSRSTVSRGLPGLEAGDPVRLVNLGQSGTLLELPQREADPVAVAVGPAGVRVMVLAGEIEPLPKGAKPHAERGKGVAVMASGGEGLDLKVIGLTVDETLPLVDRALDQALVAGRPGLTVVHGVGTGRLRSAVRRFLGQHPQVVSCRPGPGPGGAGVTVCELKS